MSDTISNKQKEEMLKRQRDKEKRLLDLQEQNVLDLLAAAWNGFIELEVLHVNDLKMFENAIDQANNIIMSRPVMRQQERV